MRSCPFNGISDEDDLIDPQPLDLLIPENVGKGSIKRFRMQRTLITWAGVSALGLYSFCTSTSPSLRAAGLGLVFPGAGLVAVATIPAAIAFVLSTVSIPLVLFAWFGAGGLFFPIALWTGTVALAAILAQETLFELSAPITVAVCVVAASYIAWQNDAANNEARAKRQMRNEYLVDAVRQNQTAAKKPDYGSRELDLRNLRFLQWLIELGLKPFDDFSYHDVIDQFQTSAIRYQLYETVSDLGLYQFVYVPNFHGYVSRAMRNCIEKSLTERVVGFWKYESAWYYTFSTRLFSPRKLADQFLLTHIGASSSFKISTQLGRTTSWFRDTSCRP